MSSYTYPDYERSALLTIDMQRDFCQEGRPDLESRKIVAAKVSKLAQTFISAGKPIIHIVRIYLENGSNVDICRRKTVEEGQRIVSPGSDGVQILPELLKDSRTRLQCDSLIEGNIQEPHKNEYIIYKPRFGAFFKTPLESFLKNRGINTLVFTGFNFPNCPRCSIYEASERDFRITAILDGISNLYERGINELEAIGINWISAYDLEKELF